MFQSICECGEPMWADSEQVFVDLVVGHMKHRHPELAKGMTPEDVLLWWGTPFVPSSPSIDRDADSVQPGDGRRLTESELTDAGTVAVLNAIKEIGHSERRIIDILITWAMTYDDIEGLDDIDEEILGVLIKERDEQPLPNPNL